MTIQMKMIKTSTVMVCLRVDRSNVTSDDSSEEEESEEEPEAKRRRVEQEEYVQA